MKTQIWIAVSVYVLVAIVRKRTPEARRCRSTHCYRSFRSQYSRKCRSSLRFWRHPTDFDDAEDSNQLKLFTF